MSVLLIVGQKGMLAASYAAPDESRWVANTDGTEKRTDGGAPLTDARPLHCAFR